MTGLLIQPLIGALSDRTNSRWGRRTPYFLVGAVLCSLGLLLMPHSSSLLMAASLLWMLDAGNNITMEPYRAYVSDRLNPDQHEIGFLSQSAFTGLAQSLAFLTPSILVFGLGYDKNAVDEHNIPDITHISFLIGAVLSISTILWSVLRVPELPLSEEEQAKIAAAPKTAKATLIEIWDAIREMPQAMRQMAWMSLFQWYGLSIYWSYGVLSIGRSVFGTADKSSEAFRDAALASGQLGALYNMIGFAAAFLMVPLSRRFGPRYMHMACLALAGLVLLYLPHITGGVSASGGVAGLFNMLAMPHIAQHMTLIIPAIGMGEHHGQSLCHPGRLDPGGADGGLYGHFQHDDRDPDADQRAHISAYLHLPAGRRFAQCDQLCRGADALRGGDDDLGEGQAGGSACSLTGSFCTATASA